MQRFRKFQILCIIFLERYIVVAWLLMMKNKINEKYGGEIKEDLGASEVYKCKKCKLEIDRDVNEARNIHIKAIK